MSNTKTYGPLHYSFKRRDYSKNPATPYRSEADVEITIDYDRLFAFMALRAEGAKNGVSKMQEGMIVARCIKRERVEEPQS